MNAEFVEDPSEPCGVCGSERWLKPGFGFKQCENGHESLDYVAHHDDDDLRQIGQKTTHAARKKKVTFDRRLDPNVQLRLYLLAYQLVLRKQVQWLVKNKKAPKELEVFRLIVRRDSKPRN
jgi:hypothetical protein